MKLEHEDADKLLKEVRDIVAKHVDLDEYKLFVFGSRVDGSGDDRSDIDIGIDGPGEVDAAAKSDILDKLENLRTLYKIDFVDFTGVSDDFREEAMKAIEFIP